MPQKVCLLAALKGWPPVMGKYRRKTLCAFIFWPPKSRCQMSLLLATNFSQNVTEPSKGVSYPVGDLCSSFTKPTGHCAYTLHGNLIPPTDGTNDLL